LNHHRLDEKDRKRSEVDVRQEIQLIAESMDRKFAVILDVVSHIRPSKLANKPTQIFLGDDNDKERMTQTFVDELWRSNWDPSPDSFRNSSALPSEIVEEAILTSLAFNSMDDRNQGVSAAYENTFKWIFDRAGDRRDNGDMIPQEEATGFVEWLECEDPSIYWITGIAGSGKSTLIKYISEHESAHQHLTRWAGRKKLTVLPVLYYFWEAGSNPLQKSLEGMLRTVLHQCLSKLPDLLPTVTSRRWASYHAMGNVSFHPPTWTLDELRETFDRVAARSGKDFRLALFLDGLDEFGNNPKDLISIIRQIESKCKGDVKMCVSSRPWTEFKDEFSLNPTLTMHDLTKADIATYIHGTFGEYQGFLQRQQVSPEACDELLKSILKKS
jgi:hypothetical protein